MSKKYLKQKRCLQKLKHWCGRDDYSNESEDEDKYGDPEDFAAVYGDEPEEYIEWSAASYSHHQAKIEKSSLEVVSQKTSVVVLQDILGTKLAEVIPLLPGPMDVQAEEQAGPLLMGVGPSEQQVGLKPFPIFTVLLPLSFQFAQFRKASGSVQGSS